MHQGETATLLPIDPPRRRRWVWLAVPALGLAAGLVGLYSYVYLASERRLREVVTRLDREDPGWRFEDLLAARTPIRDEENSALVVVAAKTALPRQWLQEDHDTELREQAPAVLLTPGQRTRLDAVMKKTDPAVTEARKLLALRQGRHPVNYKPDFISTLLPTVQSTREVGNLLALDALARANAGDSKGALEDCLAILNASRSLGDEPSLICQLVRGASRIWAVRALERTLALGEPPPESLEALQRAIEEDEREPLLLWGLRGDRAGIDGFLQFLQSVSDRTRYLDQFRYLYQLSGGGNKKPTPAEIVQLQLPGTLKNSRAAYLAYATRIVEAARLPEPEQAARLAEIEATQEQQPVLVRLLTPFVGNLFRAHERSLAVFRAAAAGIAAERYRRTHGRWPDSLAALVPEYLDKVPADPRDGQPLRFRRFEDGIVIYSIGPDDKDDGGVIDWDASYVPDKTGRPIKAQDWGFRLWDVARRRQTPVIKPVVPAEENRDAKKEQ